MTHSFRDLRMETLAVVGGLRTGPSLCRRQPEPTRPKISVHVVNDSLQSGPGT